MQMLSPSEDGNGVKPNEGASGEAPEPSERDGPFLWNEGVQDVPFAGGAYVTTRFVVMYAPL